MVDEDDGGIEIGPSSPHFCPDRIVQPDVAREAHRRQQWLPALTKRMEHHNMCSSEDGSTYFGVNGDGVSQKSDEHRGNTEALQKVRYLKLKRNPNPNLEYELVQADVPMAVISGSLV
ncbi:hypothetical protein ACLOJK_037040 [Asimina triloba]